jgi:signal peptidase I
VSQRPPGSSQPADDLRPSERATAPQVPQASAATSAPSKEGLTTTAGERPLLTRAEVKKQKKPKGPLAFLRELPALIVIAFLLALLIKSFLIQAFYIPSLSMSPTLEIGDRVLVNKLAYRFGDPERGDVIVFENPNPTPEPDRNIVSAAWHWVIEGLGFSTPPDKDFIKRVIALPGETFEQRDGSVYIDGRRLDESWLPAHSDDRDISPTRVPDGHVFVLGDNRLNSSDSRFQLGPIPMENILGKAFVIIWPPSRMGWLRGG